MKLPPGICSNNTRLTFFPLQSTMKAQKSSELRRVFYEKEIDFGVCIPKKKRTS